MEADDYYTVYDSLTAEAERIGLYDNQIESWQILTSRAVDMLIEIACAHGPRYWPEYDVWYDPVGSFERGEDPLAETYVKIARTLGVL